MTAADAVQLFWGPSFPTDQTGATDTRITVRLQLGERTTVETALPLDHLIS